MSTIPCNYTMCHLRVFVYLHQSVSFIQTMLKKTFSAKITFIGIFLRVQLISLHVTTNTVKLLELLSLFLYHYLFEFQQLLCHFKLLFKYNFLSRNSPNIVLTRGNTIYTKFSNPQPHRFTMEMEHLSSPKFFPTLFERRYFCLLVVLGT